MAGGVLLALAASICGPIAGRQALAAPERPKITPEQVRALETLEGAFTAIAGSIEPAVVQLKTEGERPKFRPQEENNEGEQQEEANPFDDMFRRFQFPPQMPRRGAGTGSGVIVRIKDRDVYILTNGHVVDGAVKIRVVFHDNTEVGGKNVVVRGRDPKTDLAVVKVTTEKPLDPEVCQARLGNSDAVRVGQWAVAVGSPFGLASTFTVGVISAVGRDQNIENTPYANFIQTDAAINPGNSGGALVNVRGEVVGINTAIATGGARANAGVGFAIPINKAKRVMDELIERGKVAHGYIGVRPYELTAAYQQITGAKEGVFVQQVMPDTPASKAGIQRQDAIVEFGGKPVRSVNQLIDMASGTAPGTKVEVKVVRKGQPKTVTMTLAELPVEAMGPGEPGPPAAGTQRAGALGIRVQDLTPELAQTLKVPEGTKGAVVTQVMPGSPAAEADPALSRGDIIYQVNEQAVADTESLHRVLSALPEKDLIILQVKRPGRGEPDLLTIGIKPADD